MSITINGIDQGVTSLFVATATLTNAQIKALPTTAIQLQAAPGSGKILYPVAASIAYDCAAGAYTNIDSVNGYGVICTGNADRELTSYFPLSELTVAQAKFMTLIAGSILDAAAIVSNVNLLGKTVGDITQLTNKALNFGCSNGLGNFTGGHASNTIKIGLLYVVVDLN